MESLRLDKLLSKSGFGSRADVKKLIKAGRVSIGGKPAKSAAVKTTPEEVRVDGQAIRYQEYIYLLMNKPAGVISATEDGKHRTVIDLLSQRYKSYEPFPVGRLDIDTEGLLLITNDGQLTHELLSPKKHIPKTYYAKVAGKMTPTDAAVFVKGVDLGGYEAMPAELEILRAGESSEVHITICEGKFHQVKKMVRAVGKEVLYLKRIRMGGLDLPNDLLPGDCREASEEELAALFGTGSC